MNLGKAAGIAAAAALVLTGMGASAQSRGKQPAEEYIHEPMPPFVQVVQTEMDGPVFTDAKGHTLYTWQAAGGAGEQAGKPTCDDTHYKETAGLLGIYPPGLELPDVNSRPSCLQLWPAVYADDAAKPAGKWTIVPRKDGKKQWAYNGYAVYTSYLDRDAGDVIGGSMLHVSAGGYRGLTGAVRTPIGPEADIPAQFQISNTRNGRMLTLDGGFSVYTWDRDGANKSNCDAACLRSWEPVLAAKTAPARGDWTIVEREPGVRQWAFRKKPLYAHIGEEQTNSLEGSDIPGWHNVYTQAAPPPPKGFTVQDSAGGQVLADAKGKTIYTYDCTDDALDAQACDHPDNPQIYRLAVCGGGDVNKCLAQFPYVIADKNAKSESKIWSVVDIDPKSGHFAKPGQADALHVWAYRQRPVYTFARDQAPGDTIADSWGEHNGWRNGYHAYWLRAEFRKHD